MSNNNVQLKGMLLFYYLMERFDMSVTDAWNDMKDHNQDMTEVEVMFLDIYDILSLDNNAIANELRKKHRKEFA